MSFFVVHGNVLQFLACFLQTGCRGIFLYVSVFQVIYPFLYGCGGHIIEIVYADDEIFGEYILGHFHLYLVLLAGVHLEQVAGVHALKHRLAVIKIVAALTKVKIKNINGIHFLYLIIQFPYLNVLCDGFRHSIQHTLQVIELACQLHLHYYYLSLAVYCLYVYAVKLIAGVFLVTLALEQFGDGDLLAYKHSDQSLQHGKICLVSEHSFHCPVKPYVFIVYRHNYLFYLFCVQKYEIIFITPNNHLQKLV